MKALIEFLIRTIVGYPSQSWKKHHIRTIYPILYRYLYEEAKQ